MAEVPRNVKDAVAEVIDELVRGGKATEGDLRAVADLVMADQHVVDDLRSALDAYDRAVQRARPCTRMGIELTLSSFSIATSDIEKANMRGWERLGRRGLEKSTGGRGGIAASTLGGGWTAIVTEIEDRGTARILDALAYCNCFKGE